MLGSALFADVLTSIAETLGSTTAPATAVSDVKQTMTADAARAASMRSMRALEIANRMNAERGFAFTPDIASELRARGDTGAEKLETAVGNILSHADWIRVGTGRYVPPPSRIDDERGELPIDL